MGIFLIRAMGAEGAKGLREVGWAGLGRALRGLNVGSGGTARSEKDEQREIRLDRSKFVFRIGRHVEDRTRSDRLQCPAEGDRALPFKNEIDFVLVVG